MSGLGYRLRRLEEQLVLVPSADEYLAADNRQRARALNVLAERLGRGCAFDIGYLFPEET